MIETKEVFAFGERKMWVHGQNNFSGFIQYGVFGRFVSNGEWRLIQKIGPVVQERMLSKWLWFKPKKEYYLDDNENARMRKDAVSLAQKLYDEDRKVFQDIQISRLHVISASKQSYESDVKEEIIWENGRWI